MNIGKKLVPRILLLCHLLKHCVCQYPCCKSASPSLHCHKCSVHMCEEMFWKLAGEQIMIWELFEPKVISLREIVERWDLPVMLLRQDKSTIKWCKVHKIRSIWGCGTFLFAGLLLSQTSIFAVSEFLVFCIQTSGLHTAPRFLVYYYLVLQWIAKPLPKDR